jgi:hypothetical protein
LVFTLQILRAAARVRQMYLPILQVISLLATQSPNVGCNEPGSTAAG